MAGETTWPLSRERHELLTLLGTLLRRFGRERFLEAPLVRADERDFPDRWEPTLHGVHQLLNRLCWHAYLDPEIVLEDHRPLGEAAGLLQTSEIELVSCQAGVVTFDVASIGNDDVAGMLSHAIGRAYLELAPDEPFRTAPREIDEREGSVAAIYLGLGVLAANSSMYRRHATQIVGREERSEQRMAMVGGLDIADATLLLAVQDILRDEVQDALSTLHGPQREWVEQWKDVLDPHEDELRALLGLEVAQEPQPLTRAPRPRIPPAIDEHARLRFNVGRETMRVKQRSYTLVGIGVFVTAMGALGLAIHLSTGTVIVSAVVALAGLLLVARGARAYYRCTDSRCFRLVAAADASCPHCGGRITKTISFRELQEHWGELRAAEDAADELIDPSEFAGAPDAALVDLAPAVAKPGPT